MDYQTYRKNALESHHNAPAHEKPNILEHELEAWIKASYIGHHVTKKPIKPIILSNRLAEKEVVK